MMARRPKLVEIGKPIMDSHDESLDYNHPQEPSVLSLKSYSYNNSSSSSNKGGKKGNVQSKIIIGKSKEKSSSISNSNSYNDSSWHQQHQHQQEQEYEDNNKEYYSFPNSENYHENESMTFMDVDDDANHDNDNGNNHITTNNHHNRHNHSWTNNTRPIGGTSFLHSTNQHHYGFGNHAFVVPKEEEDWNGRPLIVLDGANIAYAYSDFLLEKEPNVKGIALAVHFFQSFGNVQVVLPSYFMNKKLLSKEYSLMQTDSLDILQSLKQNHYLCLTPPTDDDDAYMIAIATSYPQNKHKSQQPPFNNAYIVSNDLFRDAIQRNHHSSNVRQWLKSGNGRISYSFFNIGGNTMDNNNRVIPKIEFIPNPRHSFIETIRQQQQRQQSYNNFNFPS